MTLPINREHARSLATLRRHAPDVDLVVIGAAALGHHLPLPRATFDVDLVLLIEPEALPMLLADIGWTQDERVEHRWYGPDQFRADVLPVSHSLIESGVLSLGRDNRALSLVGLDLAFEHAALVDLPTGESVRVASLPSLLVLKMVSWLDRPAERAKDLGDLAHILENALADTDDRRWADPVREVPFDEQSAYAVGVDVAAIVKPAHRKAVETFATKVLDEAAPHLAAMARAAGHHGEPGEAWARKLMCSFARGLGMPPEPYQNLG